MTGPVSTQFWLQRHFALLAHVLEEDEKGNQSLGTSFYYPQFVITVKSEALHNSWRIKFEHLSSQEKEKMKHAVCWFLNEISPRVNCLLFFWSNSLEGSINFLLPSLSLPQSLNQKQ